MGLARQLKRKQQLKEIRNSWCTKCGAKLKVRKGKAVCDKCGAEYGKVRDRI